MTNKNTDSSQASGGNPPPAQGAPAPDPPAPDQEAPAQDESDKPDQGESRGGSKVYKSGPLFLSSRGIGWTSWKKRWFILTRTSLVFFRSDPNAAPPKGSEVNLTLGGIDLNSSGSVVVKADKKLLTVLFPDGRDGRAFTLKAETSEDLLEWKAALEEALANAPSATNGIGQNGVTKDDQPDTAAETPTEQSKDKSPPKSLVLGRPILTALEDIDGTPSFLEKALRFVEEHGVKVEGILRQAADVDDVERRIREFEQGKNEFSPNEDPHIIADCIKYILRDLPSSPVPASCCNALLEACRTDRSKRIASMRAAILETFPEPNRRLLQRILVMMQTVVSHKAVNRMSTSGVAACMAPLLLRPLLAGECELDNDFDMGGDGSVQLLQAAAAANHAQAIIITLLEEYNKFFGEGSMSSGIYSDSEESGSESEELTDDGSYEDDEEDDVTEGSYEESDEVSDHASSGSCTGTGESEDDLSEEKDPSFAEVDDSLEPDLQHSADSPKHSIYKDVVEGSEHILGHSNSDSKTQPDVSGEQSRECTQDSSPKHELNKQDAPTSMQESEAVLNGPGQSFKKAAHWGRTPGKKKLSKELIDLSPEDVVEVERLENTKADLQNKIEEEAKANAVLHENLEKHKTSIHEQRLALENDVARLHELLQKERDLRAALEAGLKLSEPGLPPSSLIDEKVKAELEDIAAAEADVIDLRQKADDLTVQLNQQIEHNSCLMSDHPHLLEQDSNHRDKLKDKQKDAGPSNKHSSEKSTKHKDKSTKADAKKDVKHSDHAHHSKNAVSKADDEKDVKHEHTSTTNKHSHSHQSDSARSSRFFGHAATSPKGSAGGKHAATSSKRQASRGEGATSTTNALSKLTNRLNFLKEKRTQITSEIQNHDKGQPAQNYEVHSSEKCKGSDQTSDKEVSSEGSSAPSMDGDRRSDASVSPNLERGKSENMDKSRNVPPSRTLSR